MLTSHTHETAAPVATSLNAPSQKTMAQSPTLLPLWCYPEDGHRYFLCQLFLCSLIIFLFLACFVVTVVGVILSIPEMTIAGPVTALVSFLVLLFRD